MVVAIQEFIESITEARPKEICIDEDTYQRVEGDDFGIQQIGTIDVKNRQQPVNIYKVLG